MLRCKRGVWSAVQARQRGLRLRLRFTVERFTCHTKDTLLLPIRKLSTDLDNLRCKVFGGAAQSPGPDAEGCQQETANLACCMVDTTSNKYRAYTSATHRLRVKVVRGTMSDNCSNVESTTFLSCERGRDYA